MPYSLGKQIGSESAVAYYHKTPQSTARIARTVGYALNCRSFLWSVLLSVIDRQGMVTDRRLKYRLRIAPRNVAFCRYFVSMVDAAVDVGDVL